MSGTNEHEAEFIRQKNEIEMLNAKFDALREIISMTNKRIDFFRDTRSDTAALWAIAAALWLIAVTLGVCVIKII